ncbi:MAG TPA: C25 family cysteine peptidase [bacterium]|nr:C25 family cysteine peptidase [bacterium]
MVQCHPWIGFRRLGGFALPVLALLAFSVSSAHALSRVVESDSRHVLVEVAPEGLTAEPLSGPNGDYVRLRMPEGGMTEEAGRPEVPRASVRIAVPPGTRPRLRVVRERWSGSRPGAINPLPVRVGVRVPFGPDEVVEEPPVEGPEYTFHPRYPVSAFSLSEVRDIRGLRTVNLVWHPVIAETASRTHQVLDSALLEVVFEADPLRAGRPAERPAPRDELWDRTRAWSLANAAQARSWARATPGDGPSVGDTPWGGGAQVKVRVSQTGFVRLRFADLAAAGFPGGVPVAEVSVYQRSFDMDSVDDAAVPAADLFAAVPVPVLVRDDGNGVFDGSDSILLYGRSFRDQWMTSGWEHEDKFQTDNFYFVRRDAAGGARMIPRAAQLPSGAADSLVSTHSSVFREDDIRYFDRPADFGPGREGFETEFVYRNNSATFTGGDVGWTFTDTFQVLDPVSAGADTLVARVCPGGGTVYGSFSNVLDFTVNGTPVGQTSFFNSSLYNSSGVVPSNAVVFPHVLPPGLLVNGSNSFTFRGRTYRTGGSVFSVTRFFFDWWNVRYERQLIARNGELLVSTAGGTAADQRIRVRGFGGTDLLLLDVTNPAAPEMVTVDPSQVMSGAGGGFDLRFGHDNTGGSWATYLAARESQAPVLSAGNLEPVEPPTLLAAGIGARWVAVAHEDFVSGIQPLAAHRGAKYSTQVVPAGQVWDVFGMGGRDTAALKAFAAYAYHRWSDPIAFLLLVGDANEDHRRVSTNADEDFIPSHSLWTQYEGAAEDTDQYYAEVTRPGPGQPWDDLADLYVGRLPVGDAEELSWNITRIINYETQDPDGLWRRQAVLLADDAISGSLGGGLGEPYGFKTSELGFCSATQDYAANMLAHPYDALQPTVLCMSDWSHPCDNACYQCPGRTASFCGDLSGCDPDTLDCENLLGVDCGNWYECITVATCDSLEYIQENTCSRQRMRATGHVALRDRLNAGALLWNFEGHAHRWFLTHEEIWYDGAGSFHDAGLLKNWGKPFIFLGFACHLAEWDRFDERGTDCLAEKMMNLRQLGAPADQPGGAVAVFASSGFEFLDPNLRFNADVIDAFYYPERATDPNRLDGGGTTLPPPGDGTTYRWTLGESTTRARLMFQNRYSPQGQTRQAAQRFVLLGDPALEPNIGEPGLEVTVNGVPVEDPKQVFSINPDETLQVELVVTASDGRGIAAWQVRDGDAAVNPGQYVISDPSGGADVTADGVPLRQQLAYSFAPRQADEEYVVSVIAFDGSGTESRFEVRVTRTFNFDLGGGEPAAFPSPFSDETWFVYRTTQSVDHITVDVYSITGRRIRELHDGSLPANVQLRLRWDGRDGNGREVANGTYFFVAKATSVSGQSDRRTLPVVKMR